MKIVSKCSLRYRGLSHRYSFPQTNGSITIELFEQWAPITTNNIIGYRDGLCRWNILSSCIDDFVINSI